MPTIVRHQHLAAYLRWIHRVPIYKVGMAMGYSAQQYYRKARTKAGVTKEEMGKLWENHPEIARLIFIVPDPRYAWHSIVSGYQSLAGARTRKRRIVSKAHSGRQISLW